MLKDAQAARMVKEAFDAYSEVHKQWRNLYDFSAGVDGEFDQFADIATGKPGKYNIINGMANQICNPLEETPPEITAIPGDGATKDEAQAVSGYMRTLQNNSDAGHIYSSAFRDMVKAGVGCWMYRTMSADDPASDDLIPGIDDHENEAGEEKTEIAVEYLFPEDAACDPAARRPFKRDARYWAIRFSQNKDDFFHAFPKARDAQTAGDEFDMHDGDDIAEYFELWFRNVKDKRIERYIVYQDRIVFSDLEYKGAVIPIVWMESPVSITKDRKTILTPLSHLLVDLQAEINYWHTTMTDMIARAPKHIWDAEYGSLDNKDIEDRDSASTDPKTVLFHAPGKKPELNEPPEIPECYLRAQATNISFAQQITGLYPNAADYTQKGLDAPSGESQKQQRAMSSLAGAQYVGIYKSALKWAGKVLFNLIRNYHNDDRIRMSTGADGSVRSVSFGPTQVGGPDEGIINIDLEAGKYGIVVQTGANYATQTQELLQMLGELSSKDPALFRLLAPLIVSKWSIPGTEELEGMLKMALWPENVQKYMAMSQTNDPRQTVQNLVMQLQNVAGERDQVVKVLEATTQELNALKDHAQQIQEKGRIDLERQQMSDASRERIVDKQIHGNIVRQQVADENAMARDAQKAEFELEREEMITVRELNDSSADRIQY